MNKIDVIYRIVELDDGNVCMCVNFGLREFNSELDLRRATEAIDYAMNRATEQIKNTCKSS